MLPTNTSASVETVSRSGSSSTIAFIAAMDMASAATPTTSRMTLLNLLPLRNIEPFSVRYAFSSCMISCLPETPSLA